MGNTISEQKNKKVIVNRTYIYLLPITGLSCNLKKEALTDFRGVFLLNDDFPALSEESECLHLYFEFIKEESHARIRTALGKNLIKEYSPDYCGTVFIFQIPFQYKDEYSSFIKSKYSKLSEEYKKGICKFHNFSDNDLKTITGILYKKEEAYISQEHVINEGLPEKEWTRIPRGQEIGKRWNETPESIMMETFNKNLIN